MCNKYEMLKWIIVLAISSSNLTYSFLAHWMRTPLSQEFEEGKTKMELLDGHGKVLSL